VCASLLFEKHKTFLMTSLGIADLHKSAFHLLRSVGKVTLERAYSYIEKLKPLVDRTTKSVM
jgi:hypothetical protein